ncbi:MAG: hypothetical protein E7105_12265 [Prevotella sp.]|nr:hypothetical protein [Prevotella sp.]
MRKITLFFLMLIMGVGGVNAKTTSTTLWEGTDDGSDIFISKTSLVAGATITLEFNWLTGDGAQFSCFYWDGSAWQNIYNWKWVDNGKTFSFSLTQDQIDAIPSQLGFKTEVLGKLTFKKISINTNVTPTSSTSVWSGSHDLASWSGLGLTGSTYRDILKNAKKGDVLRVTYTSDEAGQINFCYGDWSSITGGHFSVATIAEPTTIEFEITTASILERIQNEGIIFNGTSALLSAVDLLTYDDSYDAVAVTIGSDGIATFSSSKKLDFSGTGISVYYASAVEEGIVRLTETETTWDWQGYILVGDEGTYEVPVTASASYPSVNFLKNRVGSGIVTASTEGTYHYIFAKNSSGVIGFYKLTADHTLGAKKAYLETTTDITPATPTKAVSLVFSDETTGISSVQAAVCEDQVYTLSGVRVAKPTRGLYIVGGRKVFVK